MWASALHGAGGGGTDFLRSLLPTVAVRVALFLTTRRARGIHGRR